MDTFVYSCLPEHRHKARCPPISPQPNFRFRMFAKVTRQICLKRVCGLLRCRLPQPYPNHKRQHPAKPRPNPPSRNHFGLTQPFRAKVMCSHTCARLLNWRVVMSWTHVYKGADVHSLRVLVEFSMENTGEEISNHLCRSALGFWLRLVPICFRHQRLRLGKNQR
jgi:hypothetical protein